MRRCRHFKWAYNVFVIVYSARLLQVARTYPGVGGGRPTMVTRRQGWRGDCCRGTAGTRRDRPRIRWRRRRRLLPPDDRRHSRRCASAHVLYLLAYRCRRRRCRLLARPRVRPRAFVCVSLPSLIACASGCVCASAGARVVNGQTSLPRSSSSATRRARSLPRTSVERSRLFSLFVVVIFFREKHT